MRRKRWDGKPEYDESVESTYNVPEFISMRDIRRKNFFSEQQDRTVTKKQFFLECYQKTLFNVRKTCGLVGICTKTYYNWYNTDEEFRKAVFLTEHALRTDVEDMLKRKILQGDGASIRWTLSRIHPDYRSPYKTIQLSHSPEPGYSFQDQVDRILDGVIAETKKNDGKKGSV